MTTPPTPDPLPPPDPNNPRDLRNTRAYRRGKEMERREREQQKLTITEPVPVPVPVTEENDGAVSVVVVNAADGVYNDHRNALEFLSLHHENVRFCWCRRQWVEWDGTRWEPDMGAGMQERARHFSETILQQAAECSYPTGKELMKRGRELGELAGFTALLKTARSDPRVSLDDMSVWDADLFLLGVKNGVVNLRDCSFHPAERDMMITKSAGVSYDAAATCPKWEAFVERVLPDPEVRHFMQVSAGYWLTGSTKAQCFWFLYGSGANGKTTFLETLYALSSSYSQKANGMLAEKPTDNNTLGELAKLPGVRLLVGQEVSDSMRLNESLVKDITGGETIGARHLYKPFFEFRPSCKLVMFGNHRPTISGTDGGIWRRVRLVPFTTIIPKEQQNDNLPEELLTELPGILNWCLRGLAHYHAHGLPMPPAVQEATETYREDSDVLGEFLQEATVRVQDLDEKVLLSGLYEKYQTWADDSGRRTQLNKQSLRKRMEDRGYVVKHTNKGKAICGLRLRSELDPFTQDPFE
ncbi:putative DNA primase/helicase [Roseimicrobium gellanilyticum]|uniref:Putative DNA primase/helicase n=1 Tax=Roseimicrobium gellanilyticum TaxID=748857 RepID=A0A366HXX1_9BACT|nr:phage/plasmid primase, P4 family [Roseimicrobium gellanilyticum]RBP48168.1 putative DNA primase/helicase [Roseimicrobium gellanilyticum]